MNEPNDNTVQTLDAQHQIAIAELQPVVKTTTAYAGTIDGLEIHDDEQLGLAGDLKKDLQHYRRKIEDKRTSLVGPLNKVVKDINALFKPPRDRIDGLVEKLGKKMNAYVTRQEQLERERRQQEEREAREREERLRKAAEQTRQDAGEDAAPLVEALEDQADAAAAEAAALPAKRAAPTRGDKATISTVKTWVAEVVDVRAACLAIAEGRLPADIVEFRRGDLNGLARALEKETIQDGVKYSQKITAGVR
jgi:type I site-specific restriction endonuclease